MALAAEPRGGLTVDELYDQTDHVIGQEHARQSLSVLLRRQIGVAAGKYREAHGGLAGGPTGSGKTHLIRSMCQACGLPFAEVNATQYTDKGYVGPDLSQMFLPLIRAAVDMRKPMTLAGAQKSRKVQDMSKVNPDSLLKLPDATLAPAVAMAESGVILLDEFDKWMVQGATDPGQAGALRRSQQGDGEGRNVGKKLQGELLQMVEGGVFWVTDSEEELGMPFDTTRVLIICTGAFVGLDRIVSRRVGRDVKGDPRIWEKTLPRDFENYGIMPELSGRLSSHIMFKPLEERHMVEILTGDRGLLGEFEARFADEGCELVVEESGILMLAKHALDMGVGARGLRFVLEHLFRKALFAAGRAGGHSRVVLNAHVVQAHEASIEDSGGDDD